MSEVGIIKSFLAQASAKGSRSTVLKPLGWMMAICISATMTSAYFKVDSWIIYLFAVFSGLTMLTYLSGYIYCLIHTPDALRSETYSIQKMAIQKGFVGDDLSGAIELDNNQSQLIDSTSASDEEVDK